MTRQLERARLLLEQSRYDMAKKEIGLHLARDPDDPEAHALLALCLLNNKEFKTATEHAKHAIAQAPDWDFAHYVMACVWWRRNYLDRAAESAEAALALDPHAVSHYTLLGRVRFDQRRWQDALDAAEMALEIDAEHTDAINLRAAALQKLGHKSTARDDLIDALRLGPGDAYTHANLGWTYLEQGDREKAMHHLREALRIDPELDWARAGVVETQKAGNVFYRVMLNYFTQ